MAVHPNSIPSSAHQGATQRQDLSDSRDVEAWTQQATDQLRDLHISATTYPPPARSNLRGIPVTLQIPLDDPAYAPHPPSDPRARITEAVVKDGAKTKSGEDAEPRRTGYVRCRSSIQRDSLRRREASLKGKEGSRRRQRWENGG